MPPSDWIEVKVPGTFSYSAGNSGLYFVQGSRLMITRFDPKTHHIAEPEEVKLGSGPDGVLRPGNLVGLRRPGLVFIRGETTTSVWLMKLPQ